MSTLSLLRLVYHVMKLHYLLPLRYEYSWHKWRHNHNVKTAVFTSITMWKQKCWSNKKICLLFVKVLKNVFQVFFYRINYRMLFSRYVKICKKCSKKFSFGNGSCFQGDSLEKKSFVTYFWTYKLTKYVSSLSFLFPTKQSLIGTIITVQSV